MSAALLLNGCSAADLTGLKDTLRAVKANLENSRNAKSPKRLVRRSITLTFLNQLDNQRAVPLSPSLVEELVFDDIFVRKAEDYKPEEGVKEELPFIETGEHLIDITFKSIDEPVTVPIIISDEDSSEPLFYLVNTTIDLENGHVKEISIGQDRDQDQKLDEKQDILKSQDGKQYLIHHPDGSVELWVSSLQQPGSETAISETNQPLPPGAKNPQTSGTTDSQPPQTQSDTTTRTFEFKIPKADVPKPRPPAPDTKPLPLPAP